MCCATFKHNRSPSGNQTNTRGTSDIRALKLSTRRVSRRGGHVLRAEPSLHFGSHRIQEVSWRDEEEEEEGEVGEEEEAGDGWREVDSDGVRDNATCLLSPTEFRFSFPQ